MNICHKDILLSEEIFQTDIWKSERRYLRSLSRSKGTPLLRKSERRYLRSLYRNGPRRTVGHIRNAGNGSRVIPMYPGCYGEQLDGGWFIVCPSQRIYPGCDGIQVEDCWIIV